MLSLVELINSPGISDLKPNQCRAPRGGTGSRSPRETAHETRAARRCTPQDEQRLEVSIPGGLRAMVRLAAGLHRPRGKPTRRVYEWANVAREAGSKRGV